MKTCFCHFTVVWRRLAQERLAISTQSIHRWKVGYTFIGLQFRRWQYESVFIRLAVIASKTREMSRNSKRIWPYSSSRSSKVIDLGVNGKLICDFLLLSNCNFNRICYHFRDIHAWRSLVLSCIVSEIWRLKSSNIANFTYPTLI